MNMQSKGKLLRHSGNSKVFIDFDEKFVHIITMDHNDEHVNVILKDREYTFFVEDLDDSKHYQDWAFPDYDNFIGDNFTDLI